MPTIRFQFHKTSATEFAPCMCENCQFSFLSFQSWETRNVEFNNFCFLLSFFCNQSICSNLCFFCLFGSNQLSFDILVTFFIIFWFLLLFWFLLFGSFGFCFGFCHIAPFFLFFGGLCISSSFFFSNFSISSGLLLSNLGLSSSFLFSNLGLSGSFLCLSSSLIGDNLCIGHCNSGCSLAEFKSTTESCHKNHGLFVQRCSSVLIDIDRWTTNLTICSDVNRRVLALCSSTHSVWRWRKSKERSSLASWW
mmetsp:Transcript_2416/g.3231  ORF Transcript_2416/g.3231 Transcript_2416/m.3231 type:complete len:250 (-) Transcript_2416:5750-6499(-)